MRKIDEVIIKNFQSHRDKTVKFGDYTTLVGPSDRGKTAIIRSIIWVLYNTPSGTDFITRGEDFCSVTVKFSDGLEITRSRGSKVNSYDIKFPDDTQTHLEGFGVGAVDEVVMAHGMREIDIFGSKQSLNICEQLETPFFLAETPTNKAAIIGKLAKTEIIDLAIKNTTSDIRQKKLINKEYKQKLKSVKSEISELKGLSTLEKALDFSEKKMDSINYLNGKVNNIKSILGKLDSLDEENKKLNKAIIDGINAVEVLDLIEKSIEILKTVNSIKKTLDLLDINMKKYKECELICNQVDSSCIDKIIDEIDMIIESARNLENIKSNYKQLSINNNTLDELKKIPNDSDISSAIKVVDDCIEKLNTISNLKNINDKYKTLKQRKAKGTEVIRDLDEEYDKGIKEYEKILLDSNSCPTCGSKVDFLDINKILN